jgi:resuscitation-promoting factor RpfA
VELPRVDDYPGSMPAKVNARLWELIADCESSGRWHLNTGTFDGGLQFLPSTWRAHDGTDFAPTADRATKAQQITVANRLSSGGQWLKPWPVCGKRAAARLGMRFP